MFVVVTDIYEVYYVANAKKIHCAYALNFESKEATISFDPTLTKKNRLLVPKEVREKQEYKKY
jgi:hypothetical protein